MPETTDYMIWGYALGLLILAITVGSIWWRYRSALKDEALLERLEREEGAPVTTARPSQNNIPESSTVSGD